MWNYYGSDGMAIEMKSLGTVVDVFVYGIKVNTVKCSTIDEVKAVIKNGCGWVTSRWSK